MVPCNAQDRAKLVVRWAGALALGSATRIPGPRDVPTRPTRLIRIASRRQPHSARVAHSLSLFWAFWDLIAGWEGHLLYSGGFSYVSLTPFALDLALHS